jgi:hypothetical protein
MHEDWKVTISVKDGVKIWKDKRGKFKCKEIDLFTFEVKLNDKKQRIVYNYDNKTWTKYGSKNIKVYNFISY